MKYNILRYCAKEIDKQARRWGRGIKNARISPYSGTTHLITKTLSIHIQITCQVLSNHGGGF